MSLESYTSIIFIKKGYIKGFRWYFHSVNILCFECSRSSFDSESIENQSNLTTPMLQNFWKNDQIMPEGGLTRSTFAIFF